MTFALLILTLGQCGPGGCAPSGGRVPQMFPMFPPPMYFQPPAPVMAQQPPVVDGKVEGRVVGASVVQGLLKLTLAHSDGQVWTYAFPWKEDACCVNSTIQNGVTPESIANACTSQKLTAQLRLDPAKGNAVASVELFGYQPFVGGKPIQVPEASKRPPNVQDGKKGQGCPNPDCSCGPGCKCVDCKCSKDAPIATAVNFEQAADDSIPNYGIDRKKMHDRQGRQRYSTNGGKEITKKETEELLKGDGSVPDDSAFDSLTVIGTKDQCHEVQTAVDSNPAFAPLRDKLLVQCYEPTDDMVKDKGFVPGNPSIYLQDNKGKVKARWETNPGAAPLAEEINKRRPDYDPSKDPQPLKPGPSPLPSLPNIDLSKLPGWVWVIVAFVGFQLLNKQPVKA